MIYYVDIGTLYPGALTSPIDYINKQRISADILCFNHVFPFILHDQIELDFSNCIGYSSSFLEHMSLLIYRFMIKNNIEISNIYFTSDSDNMLLMELNEYKFNYVKKYSNYFK